MLIINQIKKNEIYSHIIRQKTKNWLCDFSNIYDATHISPYIYCFGNHLHEFVDLYGSVYNFNLEGSEKLNHLTHNHVFRASNMHNDYLTQILKKRTRKKVTCRF